MASLQLNIRIRRSLDSRGVWGSLQHYAGEVLRSVFPRRIKPHPFDLRHGVHTSEHIAGRKLAAGHKHDIYNTTYLPSHPSMVSGCVDAWRAAARSGDPPLDAYTFVDLGSGMGRALMIASLSPFREVVGVELNPGLADHARRNLDTWLATPRACNNVRVSTCEATEFAWPLTPLLIYLFNPFEAPVFRALLPTLDKALDAGAGPIDILYIYPAFTEVLQEHPRARLIAHAQSMLSEEDRAADPYNDPASLSYGVDFNIYRLV
jgi:predicted RNA methylase